MIAEHACPGHRDLGIPARPGERLAAGLARQKLRQDLPRSADEPEHVIMHEIETIARIPGGSIRVFPSCSADRGPRACGR